MTDHQEKLYQRIIALSWHHPRYGYRRIRTLLAREGRTVSRSKVVQRIPRRGVFHRANDSGRSSSHVWELGFYL
ncbi:MAG: IS3 family transposase [Candidatus Latescibacterota bacterium]